MTAPDPGLTDLIAAHRLHTGLQTQCECGINVSHEDWAAHVALVVEQHTNGRIAELEERASVAEVNAENWSKTYRLGIDVRDVWRTRAERAEATIARVITALEAAEKSVPDDWGVTYIYTSQLRTALEGEQQ